MLNGRTALIVEEEFLIALDIQRMLENEGAGQTLFARTVAEAEQLRAQWPDTAVAVIEWRDQDAAIRQLVEALRAEGIPIVLMTSDVRLRQDASFSQAADIAVVIKPVPEEALAKAIRQVLALQV